MAKAGNLKLDFLAKSIGIHFFEFEDMFRCYRDNENLKKHFGHMHTLTRTLVSRESLFAHSHALSHVASARVRNQARELIITNFLMVF